MPFLDTPEGRSDGGYAVADFRKIRPDLGTMKDLAELAEKCHEEDINVCMEHDDSVLCILREYKGEDFLEYSTSVIRRRQRGCRKMEYIVIC